MRRQNKRKMTLFFPSRAKIRETVYDNSHHHVYIMESEGKQFAYEIDESTGKKKRLNKDLTREKYGVVLK